MLSKKNPIIYNKVDKDILLPKKSRDYLMDLIVLYSTVYFLVIEYELGVLTLFELKKEGKKIIYSIPKESCLKRRNGFYNCR